jgi:hypothetical protein
MVRVRSILAAAVAALAVSSAVVGSTSVEAGERTGTWRNGMVDGPYGPGYYSPNGRFLGRGERDDRYDDYRPSRRSYYGGFDDDDRPSRRGSNGGYRGASRYDQDCYTVQQRAVDDWGRTVIRRRQVCE